MRRSGEWGLKSLAAISILAATGCQLIQGTPPKVIVRRSAHEELADQRVLEEPVAIAVQEDAIVRVVGPSMTCTGTVIEDDLILTAHHCLVARGPRGEFTKHLVSESNVRVE